MLHVRFGNSGPIGEYRPGALGRCLEIEIVHICDLVYVHPRPTNGIFVAMMVINRIFAVKGKLAR